MLLTVGAPGSVAVFGAPLTHEPFWRMCRYGPSSTSLSIEPLGTVTLDCKKVEGPICTVGAFPPFPLLPLPGVFPLLPVLALGAPGREHAASKILLRARAASTSSTNNNLFLLIKTSPADTPCPSDTGRKQAFLLNKFLIKCKPASAYFLSRGLPHRLDKRSELKGDAIIFYF